MPRYFFHVYDGISLPDEEGTELANWQEAQVQAVRLAGAILDDHARIMELGEHWSLEVADHSQLVLFRIDFSLTAAAALAAQQTRRSEREAP